MPAVTEPPVSVTLAEIARIANVGRAAVSNWRRRHSTFPSPIGGSDTSPLFALNQVHQWLRDQGKLVDDDAGAELLLWPRFEALGDRDLMALAISEVANRLRPADNRPGADTTLPATAHAVVDQAEELARRQGEADTFTFLFDRWVGTHVRQIVTTPPQLAELMAEIAATVHAGAAEPVKVREVLDPACGTGSLLAAAARIHAATSRTRLRLRGQDVNPAVAALAAARLRMSDATRKADSEVRVGDSLRDDRWPDTTADTVLCNPPSNERNWGHDELAADPRWVYGHPPAGEPELAWVQHILAHLRPGGVAVVLLPPGVAARRAGRRIRAGLLRSGALNSVVALPAGAAPPHGVPLHLWVLTAPRREANMRSPEHLVFIDAADQVVDRSGAGTGSGTARALVDWPGLRTTVLDQLGARDDRLGPAAKTVPVIDLLDEAVDLTPARHVPARASDAGRRIARSWRQLVKYLAEIDTLTGELRSLEIGRTDPGAGTTVDELVRAGALTLRSGQALPADLPLSGGPVPDDALAVLTVADLVADATPTAWVTTEAARIHADALTVTRPDDIVVVGTVRAFRVWVDEHAPTVLGSQVHAVTADPDVFDPWFLAGCLGAPSNGRQAGTHASTVSRINVRRLRVLRLPLAEQRRYGAVFRKLATFRALLAEAGGLGEDLASTLRDALAEGRAAPG
ncbi:SAM-dependent methyltransferase [Yinghuangia sp. ASG 101]|uniref:N-6 DNA methylase n=1 Tax=Yinghuangia sp. ASG 101 TaxID=2896848 RepID=UPI001E5C501A|nr:N-6 DNA methylase [Yinghuangia sp. ASG 101]UGQ11271.1 SAM-dependent methyltransferase [Yinghuangia sp. ASG 101]